MALTDLLQTTDNRDSNGNLENSKYPNKNLLIQNTSSVPTRRQDIVSVCDNSVLCLHQNVCNLDHLEMRNLPSIRNISNEKNNNVADNCGQIFSGQMVNYLKSNLDTEHFNGTEWIAGNTRDRCFVNESLLMTENDWRLQCCDVNDNKNVTLRQHDTDPFVMERKDKISSRRDPENDNSTATKRPRTEQGSECSVPNTEASPSSQHTTSHAPASLAETSTGPLSYTTELSTTEHLITDTTESIPSSSGSELIQEEDTRTVPDPTSGVISVTKSMKSCNIIETKQASVESSSSVAGPLSISAQIDSSVSLTTRSQPIMPDLLLPPVSCDLYLDSLLDHECSTFSSRLTSVVHDLPPERQITNPVSVLLQHGDDMHFIPIEDNSTESQEDD